MKRPRFSLKTLVWVLTLAAVLLGWRADHRRMDAEIRRLTERSLQLEAKRALDVADRLREIGYPGPNYPLREE